VAAVGEAIGQGEVWRRVKQPGNLSQRVVGAICELVDEKRLRSGDRLPPERELAQMFGVSRPVLREAVKLLEARGTLVVRHGQGVFVRIPDEDALPSSFAALRISLAELFAMREVLEEPAAAWAAASAMPQDVELLEAALRSELEGRQQPIDFDELGRLDAAFHMLIVEIARNRFLRETLDVLQQMLAAGMETTLAIPGRLERSHSEHQAIFRAIARGDSNAARRAVRKHIREARDAALARVAEASAQE
jgi:GntR family transcriptional repressor for pyruvate dehydrogenase complex